VHILIFWDKITRVKVGKKGSKLSLNPRPALIPVLHWYKMKIERKKDKNLSLSKLRAQVYDMPVLLLFLKKIQKKTARTCSSLDTWIS
jgi:hypothetical protein